jgi:hypothetical protein
MTCTNERDNADVLLSFSRQWRAAAAQMSAGKQMPDYRIGSLGREKKLAPLLLSRAQVLEDFANDMRSGGGLEDQR